MAVEAAGAGEIPIITVGKRSFEIGALLGKGGFSEVRLGIETKTKKKIALKITFKKDPKNKKESEEQMLQVVQEIRALKKLKSPNIVKLLGYDFNGQLGGRNCIVMVEEHCPNGELFDYVMYTGRFEKKLARSVFSQFMAGLSVIHDANFAHRDLKPENLLFGMKYALKIVDLGFAQQFDRYDMRTELGTKGYMAPEILKREATYGPKVDIFSAGVILFIICTGFPPFRNVQEGSWFWKRWKFEMYAELWDMYEKKSKINPMDADFKILIQGMLKADPNERWDVQKVKESKWLCDGPLYGERELFDILDNKRKRIKAVKPTKQRATMSAAIDKYFDSGEKSGGKLPLLTMEIISKNEYREKLKKCTTIEEIREVFTELGKTKKRLIDLKDAKFLVDVSKPIEVAERLAQVCDEEPDNVKVAGKEVLKIIECEFPHLLMSALNENEIMGEVPLTPSLMNFLNDKQMKELDNETPPRNNPSDAGKIGVNGHYVHCSPALVYYALSEYCNKSKVVDIKVDKQIQLPNLCTLTVEYYEENFPKEDKEGNVTIGREKFNFDIAVQMYCDFSQGKNDGKNFIVFTRKSRDYWGLSHFNETLTDIFNESFLGPLIKRCE